MIVVDASIVANLVADDGAEGDLVRARVRAAGDLMAPDLVDVETISVLRKRWLANDLTEGRFRTAIDDLESLPIARYPTRGLVRRVFELPANVTAYGAVYVALAEGLACPLLTADARLAKAPGPTCEIQILKV